MRACTAKNCPNKKTNDSKLGFFHFPKEPERRDLWLMLCGREDLRSKLNEIDSYRICSMHFEERMFINSNRRRLLPIAQPTLFPIQHKYINITNNKNLNPDHDYSKQQTLINVISDISLEEHLKIIHSIPQEINEIINNTPSEETDDKPMKSHCSTQTSASLSANSPRKQKLKAKIKELRTENNQLKKQVKRLENDLYHAQMNYLPKVTLDDYLKLTDKFCASKSMADLIKNEVVKCNIFKGVDRDVPQIRKSKFKTIPVTIYKLKPIKK